MNEDELAAFIFYPGFSTRGKISETSGRGVGMDIVKENVQDLKGTILVASEEGHGVQFTIRIPLTLAAVRALMVTAGGKRFAIALNEIKEIVRIEPGKMKRPAEDVVQVGEEFLPLFFLTEILHLEQEFDMTSGSNIPDKNVMLVIQSGSRRGVLTVDSLIDQKEIVIKSLGSHLRYVKGISGVTIMGDGSVIPILNVDELLWSQTAAADTAVYDSEMMAERTLKVMVVDDSVSVRQVVSRLLESQGWKAQQAKDGIEALEKLSENRPDLIILDIEMPRMNGYEFLAAIRAQPVYKDIPVLMLTSRATGKHRSKAIDLGAKGFVIKPYNDDELIKLILTNSGEA